jgi:hypothetical protein
MALMISVSGIRGIFGSHLTPENLVTFTAAYGTWLDGGPLWLDAIQELPVRFVKILFVPLFKVWVVML